MAEDLLTAKLVEAQQLLSRCSLLENTPGIIKLRKKIKAELNFLSKLCKSGGVVKREHVTCSNLVQLGAVLETAVNLPNVLVLLKTFHATTNRVVVDIIADINGMTWVKVIARNPRAMYQISLGQGQFGEKSIVDHAKDYVLCAIENPVYFVPPKVKFVFTNGVFESVAKALQEVNVAVEGDLLSDTSDVLLKFHKPIAESESIEDQSATFPVSNQDADMTRDVPLNLDVTTMLAYVSALTNGSCWFRFKEHVLDFQARCERLRPVKPILDKLFEGRTLICCQTALTDFNNIISTLGGSSEKSRAKDLLCRIKIVSDDLSSRTEGLGLSSQVKMRSKIIFGTGDYHQAITVTANTGFVRSAESQGVKLAIFSHDSRALTEAKEIDATPIVLGINE